VTEAELAEVDFRERLEAAQAFVRSKILAYDPGAVIDTYMDAYGEAKWTPCRPPGLDFSLWGDWEAWEHRRQKADNPGDLEATGEWACWNANSGEGFVYANAGGSARRRAEVFCVAMNEGRRTRVVMASGAWRASAEKITDEMRAQFDQQMEEQADGGPERS